MNKVDLFSSVPKIDQGVIAIHESSESWKANVFWGLLFGLLLIVPAYFAEADTPKWKKYGAMFAGVAWMVFMGRSAIQNRGRSVRCDDQSIIVSEPFGSRAIALSEVKKVTREDVRQQLREVDEIGLSRREKLERMSTIAPMVNYNLYNAKDEKLLALDSHMQPPGEMQRFLKRMEALTGQAIVDE